MDLINFLIYEYVYNGILNITELTDLYGEDRDFFTSYIFGNLSVKDIFSVMIILNPKFIKVKNNIFLYDNYLIYNQVSENRFNITSAGKEKYVNNLCITDLFFLKEDYFDKDKQIILGKKF